MSRYVSTFRWLSRVLGTASVVMLIKEGLNVGFGPTLLIVSGYYALVLDLLLGWLEPYLELAIDFVRNLIAFEIDLYPHWKHVFVLMGVYFWSSARAAFAANAFGEGIFAVIWGVLVALSASIASGVAFVDLGSSVSTANFLIAAIPVLGVTLFDIGGYAWSATFDREIAGRKTWLGAFVFWLFYALARLAVALVVLTVGFELSIVRDQAVPGLVLLTVLVLMASTYWIGRGAWEAGDEREGDQSWWEAFTMSGKTLRGLLMLEVMVGAAAVFALNAGLRLVGL